MKILILKSIIDINELKVIKRNNNKITFNSKVSNIDLVIDDRKIYFYNYEDYSFDYTHWLKSASWSFILDALQETYVELSSMNF
ncbi:hypothetical protein OD350_28680 (plasmid) [Clostridium beijerinckii]|uniref:hypothetical protein n=1 Tax=Clostridium beijerinckii TaxID=1520 RepID=UPI002226F872|nr:hypothetical protein [Clostridium beijerinckii]UYZ39050.1 hypothetical protein OD350_28680 [Clostridium beijerinckii]